MRNEGEKTKDVYGMWYRIMSGIYGMVGILLIGLSLIAANEVEGEFVHVHGADSLFAGLFNPCTWMMFGSFLLIVVVFWFTTRGTKARTSRMEDAMLQDEVSSINMENVARDLWDPINEIADRGATMLMEGEHDRMKGKIRDVVEATEEVSSVVNEMVDFSMIASHKMKIYEKPYRVEQLLIDTRERVEIEFAKKGLELIVICDPHIPVMLTGDAARLSQIMVTILKNGLKYTDEGSVTLMVGLEPMFAGDVGLVISIRDTGQGMSKETCDNLFDSYRTAHNSMEAGFVGTGLGMAIVKRLLELMKGTVTVRSSIGEGTEFCIRIPQGVEAFPEIAVQLDRDALLFVVADGKINDPALHVSTTHFSRYSGMRPQPEIHSRKSEITGSIFRVSSRRYVSVYTVLP
ncbi:MAG: HAMP domain-containing histidine kinase, partial [Lachnospiraceae bacterium]|nr:HAMP domain-containing histidine kinase [Lachnospiraceae bacterium]